MADRTGIPWCDATWNPISGCSKVSPGCANCYAEALSLRFGTSKKPWTPENAAENVVLHPDRLEQPLRWRKPRRIFGCSMSDLFHEQVPDEFISHVFAVMSMAIWHTFLILTKRPDRMLQYLTEMASNPDAYVWAWAREASSVFLDGAPAPPPQERWPLPNVWLGVSVENQRTADERIPRLLDTPAAVRFVSYEPALGPVDFKLAMPPTANSTGDCPGGHRGSYRYQDPQHGMRTCTTCGCATWYTHLDWLIVGGESGPNHRPMELDWVRSIRDQCKAAGVAYFGKQRADRFPDRPLPGELGEREFPPG